MEEQLIRINQMVQGGDTERIVEAIKETNCLTEALALGFFGVIRLRMKQPPELDRDAIESEIAATNRPGLNEQQVAKELWAYLQNPSKVTEQQFDIIGAMLLALIDRKAAPRLREHGRIQIAGLAVLMGMDSQLTVWRTLEHGLYDWRGEHRSDVEELLQLLPFLNPRIEKYRRKSVFAYPISVVSGMVASTRAGTAPFGFFLATLMVVVAASLVGWASQSQGVADGRMETSNEAAAPASDDSNDEPQTLARLLREHLDSKAANEQLQDAAIVVLPNLMTPDVVEGLSAAGIGPVFAVDDEFGACPHGCEWLSRDDLQLLSCQIGNDTVVLAACFVPTASGRQQFRLVNLTTREVCVALTVDCGPLAIPSTAEFLAEANHHQRTGHSARCELALRKAKAAASTPEELGRCHRQRGWYLRSQNNSNRDEVIREFRQALLLLPNSGASELRAKLPAEVNPLPDTEEIERSMGQTTSLPDPEVTAQ